MPLSRARVKTKKMKTTPLLGSTGATIDIPLPTKTENFSLMQISHLWFWRRPLGSSKMSAFSPSVSCHQFLCGFEVAVKTLYLLLLPGCLVLLLNNR